MFSGLCYPQILLTRMQLGFCSLNNYLLSRNLSVSSACTCGAPYEDLVHFFLHCPIHSYQRSQFLTAFNNMNIEFANQLNENNLVRLFTTGSPKLSNTMNQNVLQNTMNFISSTKRFDQSNPLKVHSSPFCAWLWVCLSVGHHKTLEPSHLVHAACKLLYLLSEYL